MCGIYCFLKCIGSDQGDRNSHNDLLLEQFSEHLKRRGPDGFSEHKIYILAKWSAHFAGSVLWMQGAELAMQPLIDDEQNILLWNGDLFHGPAENQENTSDTIKMSRSFSKRKEKNISTILTNIKGPYAFIYLDTTNQHLYFGRDRLGRHSLLWSSCSGGLVLTSVGKRKVVDLKEIPAVGIFMVDLNSSDLVSITLFPWSDISVEMLSFVIEECALKIEVSSESIPSPITAFGRDKNEVHLDSLLSHSNGKVSSIVQVANFMSERYIKESVEKIISLLKSSLQVRVKTHPGICKLCLQCIKHMNNLTRETYISKCSSSKYCQELQQCSADCAVCGTTTSLRSNDCVGTGVKPCVDISVDLPATSETYQQEMYANELKKQCHHSKIGILFSGGLDSTILAALANEFVPLDEPIDLLNVAFEREKKKEHVGVKQKCKKKQVYSSQETKSTNLVPDRVTGKTASEDLKKQYPERQWNFVQIDVSQEELIRERERIISDLIYPLNTILDESLGCAVWFASRGKGYLVGENGSETHYCSPARVLLLGMGADELFGGYKRHRTTFELKGWEGLREELELDLARISARNLGRDDRIVSDHGCQGRLPYLDESLVSYVRSLEPWERCCPTQSFPPGVGDKLLLRLVAWKLGLHYSAGLPKRAFQFGSQIAISKEKGSDVSNRL